MCAVLQGNSITQTDGLTHLSLLLNLVLSRNRIMKITHLSGLTMLRHLSVHGNQITSLAGKPAMQLCASLSSALCCRLYALTLCVLLKLELQW